MERNDELREWGLAILILAMGLLYYHTSRSPYQTVITPPSVTAQK